MINFQLFFAEVDRNRGHHNRAAWAALATPALCYSGKLIPLRKSLDRWRLGNVLNERLISTISERDTLVK